MRYYLLLFSTFFISCTDGSYADQMAKSESYTVEEYEQEETSSANGDLAFNDESDYQRTTNSTEQNEGERRNRKIIRKANLEIEVTDYQASMQQLRSVADKLDVEITSESENNTTYRLRNYLVFRLAPERLDKFVEELEGIAKTVVNKQVSANDVTKIYADFTTRLQVREATIQRYQEILKQAKNVSEILEVERELRNPIEERDALKGELKYLNDRVARSTVELELYQKIEYESQRRGFFARLGDAVGDGWNGFLSFMIGMVSAWPFLILGGILITLLVRYRRRKKSA